MNTKEFDLQFNTLYNNVTSGKAPGLNSYEKSIFLTKSQDQILKNYFNPLGNKYQEGYSGNPKRTMDFSNVIRSYDVEGVVGENTTYKNTMLFERPSDVLIPISFRLREEEGVELEVRPIAEDELLRLYSKPYKEPFKGQAYKIDNSSSSKDYEIIVGKRHIEGTFTLYMRYVKVPVPIILTNFEDVELELGLDPGFLSINSIRNISECELDPEIHNEILDRAVNLAKIYYESGTEGILQYSSTNNE